MENNQRLASLDAVRGFDMLFIMGLEGLVAAICAFFPGGHEWSVANFEHAAWNGLNIMDLVFPTFLFIAGISWPYSYSSKTAKGATRGQIYAKILKRALILALLGIVYNGFFRTVFSEGISGVRYCSVLGRIGIAWAIAAVIYINFKTRGRIIIAAALLVGYSLLCLIPSPSDPAAGSLTMQGCLNGWIDRTLLPGVFYEGIFDPEGLLGTIPATVTAMLGMFAGDWVRRSDKTGSSKSLLMLAAAAVLLCIGLVWSLAFPINKNLWSSSFVLVVGAISLTAFNLFYYIMDVRGHRKWAFFFEVIGRNSITIYLAQAIIPFMSISAFFLGGLASICGLWGNIILHLGYIATCWLFLYFLYKKKVFLKV